jgi:hypothetical protein
MRHALLLVVLPLALGACKEQGSDAPVGNEQGVIDKAEADVAAAEAAATAE